MIRTEHTRTIQARQEARDSGRHPAGRRLARLGATSAITLALVAGTAGTAGAAPRGPVNGNDAALQREVAEGPRYCGPGQTVTVFDANSPTKQRTTCLPQVRVPHEVYQPKAPIWKFWKWRF